VRLAWIGLLLAAGGCDQVFGLDTGLPPGCSPGHDEDADGRPDSCDPCPFVDDAATRYADTDGDGVGDACDPTPDTGCEHRLAFYGFGAANDRFSLEGGAWTWADDALLQTDLNAEDARARLPRDPYDAVSVRTRIQITDHPVLAEPTPLQLIISSAQEIGSVDGVGHYGCAYWDAGSRPLVYIPDIDGAFKDVHDYSGELGPPLTLEVHSEQPRSGANTCDVDGIDPAGGIAEPARFPIAPTTSTGEVVIDVSNAAVRIEWLDIVQLCD